MARGYHLPATVEASRTMFRRLDSSPDTGTTTGPVREEVPRRGPIRPRVRLLNVDVDDVTMDELIHSFREGLMLTLHTEMLVKLQEDREFYEILPHFDVITCDSQILFAAAKLLGTPFRQRVSGSDYFPRLYEARKHDASFTVFICGGAPGVAETARRRINAKVGREIVVGTASPSFDHEKKPDEIARLIHTINASRASALVVGLGGGRQEKFIVRHRSALPHVKLFLPLGGTIDYEAGTLRRPAAWVTNAGLEWLYRVLRQPRQRWRRYLVQQPPILYLLAGQRAGLYRNPFSDASPAARRVDSWTADPQERQPGDAGQVSRQSDSTLAS